jgi:hypothetical protein
MRHSHGEAKPAEGHGCVGYERDTGGVSQRALQSREVSHDQGERRELT